MYGSPEGIVGCPSSWMLWVMIQVKSSSTQKPSSPRLTIRRRKAAKRARPRMRCDRATTDVARGSGRSPAKRIDSLHKEDRATGVRRDASEQEMVQAARDNNVALTVYHNRHFDGDYRMVKAAVLAGLVGDIVAIENRTMGARPAVGFGVPDYSQEWRITAAAGGGTMLDFGPHWVEQIVDLMDGHKIVSVFADVRNVKWGDAEDLFDIVMVFDNGVRARAAKADISYYSLPYKWIVLGTEATIHAPGGSEEITVHGPESEAKHTKAVEALSLHVNLAEHLREGKGLIITPEHALRVMQVLEAGGIPALTDDIRKKDEDNPQGYYEFEPGFYSFKNWYICIRYTTSQRIS